MNPKSAWFRTPRAVLLVCAGLAVTVTSALPSHAQRPVRVERKAIELTPGQQARPRINLSRLNQIAAANAAPALRLNDPRYSGLVAEARRLEDENHVLVGIDDRGRPMFHTMWLSVSAPMLTTDRMWPGGSSGFDLDGSTITPGDLALWDGGVPLTSHQEFGGRITVRDGTTGSNSHSTHCGGILIGAGVDPLARGMSYAAPLDAYNSSNDFSEMAAAAAAGLQISSHSYGRNMGWASVSSTWEWRGDPNVSSNEDADFGKYMSEAATIDDIQFAAPEYLVVWASGNQQGEGIASGSHSHYDALGNLLTNQNDTHPLDGNPNGFETVGAHSVAKNSMVVGNASDIVGGYAGPGSVVIQPSSSMGPCDDGRIKPDIVANGQSVYAADDPSNTAYASKGGTSMAAPAIAGSANLLVELFEKTYLKRPLASTIKAAILHTAFEAGPGAGPDYTFGWGLMNTVGAARQLATAANDSGWAEITIQQGETQEWLFRATGAAPRVTIVWTDTTGTQPSALLLDPTTPALVNDLDLRIERQSTAAVIRPWVLNPANPAAPATRADNAVDNVEQVVVGNVAVDEIYIVRVTHKGTLAGGQQTYSLMYSNLSPEPLPILTLGGAHPQMDPLEEATPYLLRGNFSTASLFVTAIKDFTLKRVHLPVERMSPGSVTLRIHAADGLVRGSELAAATVNDWAPGLQTLDFGGLNLSMFECGTYELALEFPDAMGILSYVGDAHPTLGTMPLPWDASGAFRIVKGTRLFEQLVPAFDWVLVPTNPTSTEDLAAGISSTGTSSPGDHGMFFKVKNTANLSTVTWDMTTTSSLLRAKLYEAPGGVRGALISDATMAAGPSTTDPTLPLSAVVEEGKEYELVVNGGTATFPGWANGTFGLTYPYLVGAFEVQGASGNVLPHLTLGYESAGGGTRYTYNPNGGNSNVSESVLAPHVCGMFLTATADHEILSVDWPTNAPEDATHTVRIYEAAGGVAGNLITEGTVGSYPNGENSKFHTVPLSASIANGSQYYFEFVLDFGGGGTHKIYGFDADAYGSFDLNGFQFDSSIHSNGVFPYMRFNQCDPLQLVGVGDPMAQAPAFSLSAPMPNPTRSGALMRFALDRAGEVRLDLLDVTGRRVAHLYHAWRPAGPGEVRIDSRGLAPGVYMVSMRAGGRHVSRRITIVQ